MQEFFNNIWEWVVEHSGEIAAILTPANIALVVGALIGLLRQKKVIKENTGSSRELKESLKSNKELIRATEQITAEITALKALSSDIADGMNQSLIKQNAVLDVQEMAYSVGLSGTKTMDAVNGIIANARFAETSSRRAVSAEVAALNAKIAELVKAGEDSTKKINNITNIEVKPGGARYD